MICHDNCQTCPRSEVTLAEDCFSSYFEIDEVPRVLNLPSSVDKDTGAVIRQMKDFSVESVMDHYYGDNVPLKSLLDDIFYTHGRVRPHERVLCWFPKYLEYFLNTSNVMIGKSKADSGVLAIEHKLFLAIMAVSCYKCDYLLGILEEQFVQQGGNLEWLADGLQKVGNLSKFAEINEVLAFKPWILSVKHVERLLEKDESGFSWSLEQVCLAVCIMSSYHALCSFVLG